MKFNHVKYVFIQFKNYSLLFCYLVKQLRCIFYYIFQLIIYLCI